MVLKKGKFNANSGNTLRRSPLNKTASFISKGVLSVPHGSTVHSKTPIVIGVRVTFCPKTTDLLLNKPLAPNYGTFLRKGNYDSVMKDKLTIDVFYEVEAAPPFSGWPFHHESSPNLEIMKKNRRYRMPRKLPRVTKERKKMETALEEFHLCKSQIEQDFFYDDADYEEVDMDDVSFIQPQSTLHDLSAYLHQTFSKDKKDIKCPQNRRKTRKARDNSTTCRQTNQCTSQYIVEYPKRSMIYVPPSTNPDVNQSTDNISPNTTSSTLRLHDSYNLAPEVEVENEYTLDVDESEISVDKLHSVFSIAHVEGLSSPRNFVISVGLCTPREITSTNGRTWTVCSMAVKVVPAKFDINGQTIPIKMRVIDDNPVASKLFANVYNEWKETKRKVNFKQLIYQFVDKYYEMINRLKKKDEDRRKGLFVEDLSMILGKGSNWYSTGVDENMLYISSLFESSMQNYARTRELIPEWTSELLYDIVCSICLETASPFDCTMLLECSHVFCNSCWAEYLSTQIGNGLLTLKCPETKCDTGIDIGTIAFLVPLNCLLRFMKNTFETKILSKNDYKWCPGCQTLAKVSYVGKEEKKGNDVQHPTSKRKNVLQDTPVVHCQCGKVWCFLCEKKAHWPASCSAYKEHEVRKQERETIFDENGQPYMIEIEIKKCPFCRLKIERNNGCKELLCLCGNNFCWYCLQALNVHVIKPCLETRSEKVTFSSLDNNHDKRDNYRMLKISEGYQNKREEWKRLKTKLKIAKWQGSIQDHTDLPLTDSSHFDILQKAFISAYNSFYLLEQLAIARSEIKSRHVHWKIVDFSSKLDFILGRLQSELAKGKTEKFKFEKIKEYVEWIGNYLSNISMFDISAATLEV